MQIPMDPNMETKAATFYAPRRQPFLELVQIPSSHGFYSSNDKCPLIKECIELYYIQTNYLTLIFHVKRLEIMLRSYRI